jgi:hypothetical protein
MKAALTALALFLPITLSWAPDEPRETPKPEAKAPAKPTAKPAPVPKPELTPAEVVRIQLDALKNNDEPTKDAGIAVTFAFASPGNREATGPLEKFALIVKNPAYRPMIGHKAATVRPIIVAGDVAIQRVKILGADGKVVEYEFRLSKDAPSGCWFTDGVLVVPDAPTSPPGNVA